MEKSFTLPVLCVKFILLDSVYSFPIDISSVSGVANPLWLTSYFITGFGFFLIIFSIVIGCVCCRNGKGFKPNEVKVIQEFRNSSGNLSVSRTEGSANPTLNSELTIFPPLGANANEICRFEPLPDNKCQTQNLRPAAFSYTEQEISSQDWFFDPYSNFPRNQLKYVQEYGRGWFGRVVEGEAQNITPEEKVTKVMVKILHEDATATDHMYFLHEVKFYRDLKHPNILRLLGRCLETEPFLIILECYPNGDLKTFLSQNLPSAQALVEQGVTLQMCSNITSGLQFMHENKFIHTDLAARNCLVGPDLSVKIGDYGNSIEIFKSDYYCAGSVALPVRWCAPETLKCTDITIETREVTPPANIWSLGVVFWEICEFCKLPYAELSDDEVIVRVLGEKSYFLEKPNMICLYKDELYHLMKLCWKPPLQRPNSSQICLVLNNLISSSKMPHKEVLTDSKRISQDFEQRWQNLKPNSIPKKDNAINVDHDTTIDCNMLSSKLKNAKVVDSSYVDSPLGIFLSNKNGGQKSPRICLKFDKKGVPKAEKNSLQDACRSGDEKKNVYIAPGDNFLKDSASKIEFDYRSEAKTLNPFQEIKNIEPEMDSWLKGVEINSEEDESFVRKISEAIRDLDATLAMEKTSSSEENSGKSSHQNSPGKDLKTVNEPVVDFKLGNDTSSFINFTQKTFDIASLQNTEQPQSLNFTDTYNEKKGEESENYGPGSLIKPFIEDPANKIKREALDESLRESDSLICGQSRNSSDTDDEIWRRRIEKGEISEKVKEKSKSIANLMILTHIDSDDSDIDLDKTFDRGLNRNSFHRKSGSFAKSSLSSNNFGSENDLTFAVLEDDFKESLKKLNNDHKERGHFDSLGVILSSSANRENVWESLFKPSNQSEKTSHETAMSEFNLNKTVKDSRVEYGKNSGREFAEGKSQENPQNRNNFLGNVASENFRNNNLVDEKDESSDSLNESFDGKLENSCLGVKEHSECDSGSHNHDCVDSLKNSSHLKEGYANSDSAGNNTSEDLEKPSRVSLSPQLKHNQTENFVEEFVPTFADGGKLLSKEKNMSNQCAETENLVLNLVRSEPGSETLKVSSEVHTSFLLQDLEFVEKASYENVESPNTKSGGALNKEKEPVAVQKVSEYLCQPFKSVFKNDVCLPEITISEEPNEALSDIENEKFDFMEPILRPIKFVLKDIKSDEAQNSNVESFSSADASAESLMKNSGNDFDEFRPEENVSVIVGACEDFTMDYFKGLKTTSGTLNGKNEEIAVVPEEFPNDEENFDVWDKNLEKVFNQQLTDSNFDDVNFRSFGMDYSYIQEIRETSLIKKFPNSTHPIYTTMNFIESEKLHTEKVEDPVQINRLTNLAVITNEEEYEHFKLRTPDDERSSDSGFRDKGSLSESVEDAYEGKYNLEDIEAELEEAFVKGVFGNSEADKEKDLASDAKNRSNFDYEESKFYEDGSKNEEDFSDIDGEIEFWHNKDESDYYPEISEFHPACSQGWYLHPPDESTLTFNGSVNEDVVNALRNELRESLPVQSRSFDEYNDFYDLQMEDANRDLNAQCISEFALPLSPILEEQDSSNVVIQENIKNSLLDGSNPSKVRKGIVKLMESVKAVDTTTFMHYLDYMIENEGKFLDEIEEAEEDDKESKENVTSPAFILEKDSTKLGDNAKECTKNFFNTTVNSVSDPEESSDELLPESLEPNDLVEIGEKVKDDILVINIQTHEATLLERSKPELHLTLDDNQDQKSDYLEILTDNLENNEPALTSEFSTPERERSLSEISRSSNGSQTGDALSEITLSSPDLVPDCFSTSAQEAVVHFEPNGLLNELNPTDAKNELDSFDNRVILYDLSQKSPELSDSLTNVPSQNLPSSTEKINPVSEKSLIKLESSDAEKTIFSFKNNSEENDLYEMSTSFMEVDDEDDDTDSNLGKFEQDIVVEEQNVDQKFRKYSVTEDSVMADWQSESSEDEEMSSSSGEFIWKDGNKESKLKAVCASDNFNAKSLCGKSQNSQSAPEVTKNESTFQKKNNDDGESLDDAGNEDEDNESSTGSSASITDFIPSAWNSQATPSRSALRSPDKKVDKQKKNVWFKKQKYHCVYEYPREPSDNEDVEDSSFSQSIVLEKNLSEAPNKHFNYGVNTVELPNKYFPYGISKVIDFSSFTDWDVVEGEDLDLSLTDTDSENGSGKTEFNVAKRSDLNFYNLSPFDYDFNTSDMPDGENEFFVSSSSRPFQGSSSILFTPGNNHSVLIEVNNGENKIVKNDLFNSKDFVTPDSGIEDSISVTPSESQENVMEQVKNVTHSKAEVFNGLDNLKNNLTSEKKENEGKDLDLDSFEGKTKSKNGFSSSETASIAMPNNGLGELRHTRAKLKLDLPRNLNSELGAIIYKNNH